MRIIFQVLGDDSQTKVHERTTKVLAETGVRVDTARGRQFLSTPGADVDEKTSLVRFPRALVEELLKLATKKFSLGARRPGIVGRPIGASLRILEDFFNFGSGIIQ